MLLNQPVANLVEWGKVAANSDEFKHNMAEMFFRHALGREPMAADQADFQAMWRALPGDGYSANKLLHRMPGKVFNESDIYGIIAHALDLDSPNTSKYPAIVRG